MNKQVTFLYAKNNITITWKTVIIRSYVVTLQIDNVYFFWDTHRSTSEFLELLFWFRILVQRIKYKNGVNNTCHYNRCISTIFFPFFFPFPTLASPLFLWPPWPRLGPPVGIDVMLGARTGSIIGAEGDDDEDGVASMSTAVRGAAVLE